MIEMKHETLLFYVLTVILEMNEYTTETKILTWDSKQKLSRENQLKKDQLEKWYKSKQAKALLKKIEREFKEKQLVKKDLNDLRKEIMDSLQVKSPTGERKNTYIYKNKKREMKLSK